MVVWLKDYSLLYKQFSFLAQNLYSWKNLWNSLSKAVKTLMQLAAQWSKPSPWNQTLSASLGAWTQSVLDTICDDTGVTMLMDHWLNLTNEKSVPVYWVTGQCNSEALSRNLFHSSPSSHIMSIHPLCISVDININYNFLWRLND